MALAQQFVHLVAHRLAVTVPAADEEQRLFGALRKSKQGFDLPIGKRTGQLGIEAERRGNQLESLRQMAGFDKGHAVGP